MAVGAVHLRPPDRQPTGEGVIELTQTGEAAAGQDVLTHDQYLPFNPAFAGRAVGRQRVDREAVVLGEHRRLRVQRNGLTGRDMAFNDGLGPAIEPGTPPKCANARRWQSQNVARSIEDVKQVNGSRENDSTMWKE